MASGTLGPVPIQGTSYNADYLHIERTTQYIHLSSLSLMVYDHALTFAREKEYIWSLPWRLPKVLFIFSRYLISPALLFIGVVSAMPGLSESL
ncbi:hypothetical protein PLICRDRAFT_39234 [Plicaturopsis crispa FD-325 SS-3]|nr:hypothetical protein PLICRDRAFT_39234 [Plicaturopsis crispa FD-325 SS-3]